MLVKPALGKSSLQIYIMSIAPQCGFNIAAHLDALHNLQPHYSRTVQLHSSADRQTPAADLALLRECVTFKNIQPCYVCRYIQAASTPKNIVILLDTSGSMMGKRMAIAQSTVSTILDTLSDEDYFNITKVRQSK